LYGKAQDKGVDKNLIPVSNWLLLNAFAPKEGAIPATQVFNKHCVVVNHNPSMTSTHADITQDDIVGVRATEMIHTLGEGNSPLRVTRSANRELDLLEAQAGLC
jgi:hypothetical protein